MSEPTVSERAPSQEAARRFFDRWARFYGADPCSRWIRRAQRRALTALELDESDRLLDVGCGPGVAVCEAAPLVARATGLDLSPAMVARARSRADGIPNVEIVEGDSAQLPFPDGAFTAVLSTTSFHHYPEPDRALGEMRRVLEPSGRIALGRPQLRSPRHARRRRALPTLREGARPLLRDRRAGRVAQLGGLSRRDRAVAAGRSLRARYGSIAGTRVTDVAGGEPEDCPGDELRLVPGGHMAGSGQIMDLGIEVAPRSGACRSGGGGTPRSLVGNKSWTGHRISSSSLGPGCSLAQAKSAGRIVQLATPTIMCAVSPGSIRSGRAK